MGPDNMPLVLEPNERARDLAALNAVFSFWGRPASAVPASSHSSSVSRTEPLLAGDSERFARAAGLTAVAFHGTLEDVVYELRAGRPVLVGVTDATQSTGHHHLEVVVGCNPRARRLKNLDPARGMVERTYASFQDEWERARQLTLVMFVADEATGNPSSTARATRDEPRSSRFEAAPPSHDAWRLRRPVASPSQHVARR